MPKHNFKALRGKVEYLTVNSRALANNLLGDPTSRQVAIYLPENYETSSDKYPLLVDIVGFTGSGFSHIGWKAFAETLPQRIERLQDEGKMGEVIVALPDCFTSLGGNQYINSSAMGNWADFLTSEMLTAIEQQYRVKPGREHRAIFGKSSGGYGAMIHGMLHADTWAAIACHSGDADFELCYRNEFPAVLMQLAKYEQGISGFMKKLEDGKKVSGSDMNTLMMLAMAATYDPDPNEAYGIRLPVTDHSCTLIEERWKNWLAWDPLTLINDETVQANLNSLSGLYIDCGSVDQYNLVFGARQLDQKMKTLGIEHHYEEFPDNHSSVDYRMDTSLPFLFNAMTA